MSRIIRRIALLGFGALALAGCTPTEAPQASPTPEATGGQSFAREMSATDRDACTSTGGRVERRGRIGAELCARPFVDAGKPCTDSGQCEGKCVGSADQASATTPVAGQCQADDRLFGCYAEIKGGKAVNAICVD